MGSETRKATKLVAFRATPEEHAAILAAAEACGYPLGTWARRLALEAAGRPLPPVRARRDRLARSVGAVLGSLGRIGSNVNQLAKVANATGSISGAAVAEILDELRGIRAAVLQALEEPEEAT